MAESPTGSALALVIVCVSCAPDNASQSVNALDFGKQFSSLAARPKEAPSTKVAKIRKRAENLVQASKEGTGTGKYAIVRAAQGRTGQRILEILARLIGD